VDYLGQAPETARGAELGDRNTLRVLSTYMEGGKPLADRTTAAFDTAIRECG
jgi:hypothetical protein